jgi:heptosyltransferase-2
MEKTPLSISLRPTSNNSQAAFTDVIWLQTSFIGDIILTTAAMAALAKVAPDVKQHIITTAAGAAALEGHPLLASIHVFNKRKGLLTPMRAIKGAIQSLSLKSAVTIQPHRSLRSTLLAKYLGFPSVTYNETALSLLANVRVPRITVFHETDRIALLLQGLGIARESFLGVRPTLPVKPPPSSANFLLNKNLKWVAIAPGSVWATKRWPAGKFAALAANIVNKPDHGVVLLGGKEDAEICKFIEGSCKNSTPAALTRLVNLAGKTSLQDLQGIYPYLHAVISNDSSPIHYASAFNIPTLAIFGATVPAMGFGPLAERSQVAQVDLGCRPCGDHGHRQCPLRHFKCMNELSVDGVLDKFAALMV